MTMTETSEADGLRALNEAMQEFRREEAARVERKLCIGCGAVFLAGGDSAEVSDSKRIWTDDGGIEVSHTYRMCFWCWDAEGYDPSDPTPSKFQYGRC